jgi:hypothetical protein
MTNLRSILQQAWDHRNVAGSNTERLTENLKAYQKQQFTVFTCIELFLVTAVAFCAYYLTKNPANTGTVKVLASIIGIGAGGGIEAMRRVWSQWSQTTLLLLLIPESTDSQLAAIIDKLTKRL